MATIVTPFRRTHRTLAATVAVLLLTAPAARAAGLELLNVSYDPTRELWKAVNAAWAPRYGAVKGTEVAVSMSHGGSGSQARAVVDGLDADVVTLALWPDTNAIAKAGLIRSGWEERFPNRSVPYTSTIVFVVRKGNPKNIRNWADLARPDIQIVTPNPKTSGNGKLAFLAAWGSVTLAGGTEEDARAFVTQLYRKAPVLDLGARGATVTFVQKRIGDVHLTWENEAHLEVQEARGAVEIVYPSRSILAEPPVAIVDANAARRGTRDAAQSYLEFLYTPEGQELIARHHYRPIDPEVLARHRAAFPDIPLFPVTAVAKDWDDAYDRFFTAGKIFDQIYERR